jgi:hypothetical protein
MRRSACSPTGCWGDRVRSGRNDAGYELCDLTRRLRSQRFCPACEDRSPALSFLVEAEVRVAQGETAGKICRSAGISEQTCYTSRWSVTAAHRPATAIRPGSRSTSLPAHRDVSFEPKRTVHLAAAPLPTRTNDAQQAEPVGRGRWVSAERLCKRSSNSSRIQKQPEPPRSRFFSRPMHAKETHCRLLRPGWVGGWDCLALTIYHIDFHEEMLIVRIPPSPP